MSLCPPFSPSLAFSPSLFACLLDLVPPVLTHFRHGSVFGGGVQDIAAAATQNKKCQAVFAACCSVLFVEDVHTGAAIGGLQTRCWRVIAVRLVVSAVPSSNTELRHGMVSWCGPVHLHPAVLGTSRSSIHATLTGTPLIGSAECLCCQWKSTPPPRKLTDGKDMHTCYAR